MGNSQSSELPRRPSKPANKLSEPRKLSKPRTNTTSNVLSNVAPSAPSRRNSRSLPPAPPPSAYTSTTSLDDDTMLFDKLRSSTKRSNSTTKESTDPLKSKLRLNLFRSKSSKSKADAWTPYGDGDEKLPSVMPDDRWSRAGIDSPADVESFSDGKHDNSRPIMRGHRASLPYVPYSYQASRLSLVIEAQSPEPNLEEASRRLNMGMKEMNSVFVPAADYDSSGTLRPIPIRRRSLQTPGIATRHTTSTPVQRPTLQTIPTAELWKNYFDMPNTQPQPADYLSVPKNENSRVQTPSELEGYNHCGAFKMGTLRITNGAASPALSAITNTPSENNGGDYLTAGQARAQIQQSLENKISHVSLNQRQPSPVRQKPTVNQKQPSPVRAKVTANQGQPSPVRARSPLRREPDFARLDFEKVPVEAVSAKTRTYHGRRTSEDLAQSYMEGLESSPFSFVESPPRSPRLEATSKPMATEDDLFEDAPDAEQPKQHKQVINFSGKRQGMTADSKRQTGAQTTILMEPKTNESSDAPDSRRKELAAKPLSKTDSGYSSIVSLKSIKARKDLSKTTNPSARDSVSGPEAPECFELSGESSSSWDRRDYSSGSDVSSMEVAVGMDDEPETKPSEPTTPTPANTRVRSRSAGPNGPRARSTSTSPSPPMPHRLTPTAPQFTLYTMSIDLAPQSEDSHTEDEQNWSPRFAKPTAKSTPSRPELRRKNTKANLYSQPASQSSSAGESKQVTAVPKLPSKEHQQRLQDHPRSMSDGHAVPIVTLTKATPTPSDAKSTEVRGNVPRVSNETNVPKLSKDLVKQSQSSENKPTSRRQDPNGKTPKRTRRHTSHVPLSALQDTEGNRDPTEEEFMLHITSVESVHAGLGGSPYDLAMTAMDHRYVPETPSELLPQKQNGGGRPTMDAWEASQLARRRSRDRQQMTARPESVDASHSRRSNSHSRHPLHVEDVPPLPPMPGTIDAGHGKSPPVSKQMTAMLSRNGQTQPGSTHIDSLPSQTILSHRRPSAGQVLGPLPNDDPRPAKSSMFRPVSGSPNVARSRHHQRSKTVGDNTFGRDPGTNGLNQSQGPLDSHPRSGTESAPPALLSARKSMENLPGSQQVQTQQFRQLHSVTRSPWANKAHALQQYPPSPPQPQPQRQHAASAPSQPSVRAVHGSTSLTPSPLRQTQQAPQTPPLPSPAPKLTSDRPSGYDSRLHGSGKTAASKKLDASVRYGLDYSNIPAILQIQRPRPEAVRS